VVCAVTDGATSLQGLIDFHCSEAERVLDFPHGQEYVASAGRAVFGDGSTTFEEWFASKSHLMKNSNGAEIIESVKELKAQIPLGPNEEGVKKLEAVEKSLSYLETRQSMLRYAHFRELGYPIGSGATESANKVVVEARLKGAGMHWLDDNINPMLALRNLSCNERWEEGWQEIEKQMQVEAQQKRLQRGQNKPTPQAEVRSIEAVQVGLIERLETEVASKVMEEPKCSVCPSAKEPIEVKESAKSKEPHRPRPDHPWRRMGIGRALYGPRPEYLDAKN
jgi:hypothetical protein